MTSSVTKTPDLVADGGRRSSDAPKTRTCLRCSTEFPSEWSGERICKRCKSTSTWRNGLPATGRRE